MTTPTDTYANGMHFVIVVLFTVFVGVSLLEVLYEWKKWPSVSYRFEDWAIKNRWFSSALLLVVFTLLAHFVLNPLCPADQPLCP